MISDAMFEDLVQATQRLSAAQKSALFYRLQNEVEATQQPLTREKALAELRALRAAGAFAQAQSLYGKYALSGAALTDDTLEIAIHEASTAWETELDEFDVTDP